MPDCNTSYFEVRSIREGLKVWHSLQELEQLNVERITRFASVPRLALDIEQVQNINCLCLFQVGTGQESTNLTAEQVDRETWQVDCNTTVKRGCENCVEGPIN